MYRKLCHHCHRASYSCQNDHWTCPLCGQDLSRQAHLPAHLHTTDHRGIKQYEKQAALTGTSTF